MAKQQSPPPSLAERLRQLWKHWGRITIIVLIAHAIFGGALTTLYFLSRPPPPRYVVVDLIPARATPAPTVAPENPVEPSPSPAP
ncbi:MAG: hypothetical protein M3O62_10095 [Pseudomonadota bacterium]|nr:hypothetical protein [Pseudomonadota bacterium]